MSSNYKRIDPYKFEVSEAIKLLNSNIDYVYNLANNVSKENIISSSNIIPYADFSVISNLSYWRPLDNTRIFFQNNNLKITSSSNILGLISPVFSDKVDSYQTYTLVLNTSTDNSSSLYINKAYILQEDNTQIPLQVYAEVKSKEFTVYSLVFQFDTTITNGRLVLISENILSEDTNVFKYEDKLISNFFNDKGYLKEYYDLDNTSEYYEDEITEYKLIDTIRYSFYNDKKDVLSSIESNKVLDNNISVIPSIYYPNVDENSYVITTTLEQFIYTELKLDKGVDITDDLSIIASYYNLSKVKGAFQLVANSEEYSLLSSLYVYRIINKYIVRYGNTTVLDINGVSVNIAQIGNDIFTFIKNNINNILSSEFIKGGFVYIESETGQSYSLDWRYLNEDNSLSKNNLSVIAMYDIMEKLQSLNIDTSKYHNKIINSFNYNIPDIINIRGESSGDYKYSVKTLFYIHFYKKVSDSTYKNDFINLILEYKQENGLYKTDYTSSFNKYSNSQYLEYTLNNSTLYSDYIIYFKTIAIGKGNSTSITNNSNSNFNSVVEQIKNVKIDVDEDSIMMIAEEKFVDKKYFQGELDSIYESIKSAGIEIDYEHIAAKVIESQQFLDLSDRVNTIKEMAESNKSSIEMLDDKIELSVNDTKLQSYLSQSSNIGSNLVQNSCFLRDLGDFTQQGTLGEIITTEQGKVYYHINTASPTALRQELQYNLYEGDYVVGLEVYGSGSITINIYNSEDDSLISSREIVPSTLSQRYDMTFYITDITKVDLEIFTNNANLYFSYIKLCRGTKDFGWTLSSEDMSYLANSINENYQKVIKYYNNVAIEDLINDVISKLELESNKLISIINITLIHPILRSTTLLSETSQYLSEFTDATVGLISYLREDNDKSILNDKTTIYYNSFIKLINSLSFIIDYVANFDVSKNNSTYINSIKKDLVDVNDNIEALNNNLKSFFIDGILTSEEKTALRNNISVLEREKAELDVRVTYYTQQEVIKDSEEVILLSQYHSNYNSAYTDIITLVNNILEADKITQDMKYVFNSKYDIYKQQSELLQGQLLKVASKYNSTQTQIEINKVDGKVSDLEIDLKGLQDTVKEISYDSVLTTLEKKSLQNKLQEMTHSYLTIKAEIDYYQAQASIKDSNEISNLNSLEAQLDAQYNTLKTEVTRLLEGTTITDEDISRVDGYISNVLSVLEGLKSAIADCLLKMSAVASGSDITGVLSQIEGIQTSLDSLINFTNEAWKDELLTFTETITLVDLVNQLALQIQVFLDRVDVLLNNDYVKADTILVSKLGDNKRETETAFESLQSTIQTISTDGAVNSEEKILFNNALNTFYSKLNALRGVIAEAENKIIQGETNKVYEDSKKYVDDNYQDVKDTVTNMNNFTDTAWVDGIITKAESVTFNNLLDTLYKESLDMKKQAEVYISAALTPELQGTTELASLVTTLASYDSAYTSFYDAVQEIANFKGVTSKDKATYERTKTQYEAALVNLVQDLLTCSKKVSEVKTNSALGFTDKDGNTTTVVDWIKNADMELTKEKIKLYVENNSTVLIKSDYLESNYMKTSELEKTYATKSEITTLDGKISLTVKTTEMKTYKEEFLNEANRYTDTKVTEFDNSNTKSLDIQFYLSNSSTELIGGQWSTTAPEWTDGKYMWQKIITTLGDGTIRESQPTCISGAKGPKGEDGTSFRILDSYTTLEELKSAHPTNDIGDAYMVGDNVYTWTGTDFLNLGPIKGADGQDGQDGRTPYVHFKYSNDNGTTFTTNNGETPGEYLGTLVDFNPVDSAVPSDYTWVKVKGEPGADGIDGLDAQLLFISADRQVISFDRDGNAKDLTDITLTIKRQNCVGEVIWVTNPSVTLTGTGDVRTLSPSAFNENKSISITVSLGDLSDTITLVKVVDGNNGLDGEGYTIFLSNEMHTFTGTTYSVSSQSCFTEVVAYREGVKQIITVGTIINLPTGMTATVHDNNTTYPSIRFNITSEFNTESGVVNIPITVGTLEVIKVFSYSLVRSGNSPKILTLTTNRQAIAYDENNNAKDTSDIILYARQRNYTDTITWTTDPSATLTDVSTTGSGEDLLVIKKLSVNNFNSNNKIAVTITAGDLSDTITLVKVVDGNNGSDGVDGLDAYTVVLSNESHTFAGSETSAIASSVITKVIAYKGSKQVNATIGDITGLPSGMTHIISDNNTISPSVKFTVDTTMVTKSGVVTIPITVDGNSFIKSFSYSLSLKGDKGDSATLLSLQSSKYAVAYNSDNTLKDSSSIVLTATQQNYSDTITWSTDPSVTLSGSGLSRTLLPSNFDNNDKISITISAGGLSDTVTIVKIKDGSDGINGEDAYTVLLSNESHTFIGDTSSAIASSITCNVISYRGGTKVSSNIGTVTGMPTGMNVTVSNNDSTNASLVISVTTAMTSRSGTLSIPITVDGIQFIKEFSYTLSLKGQDGSSAYAVVLSNESHTFTSTSAQTLSATTMSYVYAYKGSSKINCIVGTISNVPTGMTITVGNNGTTSTVLTIKVDSTFTTRSGLVDIPVTADGVEFTKQFAYSLVYDGTAGSNGEHAKYLGLFSNTQVVSFKSDNTPKSSSNVNLFTNQAYLTEGITWTTEPEITLVGQGRERSISPSSFINNNSIKVTVTSGDLSDSITIVKVIDGADGANGVDGKNASSLSLLTNRQVVLCDYADKVVDPTPITLRVVRQNLTGTITWTTDPETSISGTTGDSNNFPFSALEGNDSVAITVTSGDLSDTLTIVKIKDGEDAYTVVLSNESHTFIGDTSSAIAGSTTINVIAYKGITKYTTSVGTISGHPTGMTTTISNNNSTSTSIKVNVTTSMTTRNGTLSIPITVNGITFYKDFTYSLALKGDTGSAGKDAKFLSLSANRQVISYDENNNAKDSTAITLTATQQNYSDTITWSTDPSVTLSGSGLSRTLLPSNFNSNLQIKVTITAGDLSDSVTLAKVIDGTSGQNGQDGKDAYTVILTNEAHTFTGNETSALSSSTTTQVIGYKGATQQAVLIGTITGLPTGMTASISNNNSTNAAIKIDVTSSMTTKNGILTIPVTIDGHTFNKVFTYSLALKGDIGTGVKSVTEEYALGTSSTEYPTSGWSTTCPLWESGKYLWCRLKIEYENPSRIEYAGYYVDTSWQAVNQIKIGGRNLWVLGDLDIGYEANGTIASILDHPQHKYRKTLIDLCDYNYITYQVWNPNKIVNSSNSNRVAFYDENKSYISPSVSIPLLSGEYYQVLVIKVPNNAKFVRLFAICGLDTYDDSIKIKFELGNQPTDWSPAPEDTSTYIDDSIYALETDLQSQIDGKIETFSQTTDPSISWSEEDKSKRTGDLWYDGTEIKRWLGTEWGAISENTSLKSLANSKAQVFTSQPTIPYYKDDLWVTALDGTGVVKTCNKTRTEGSFVLDDWVEGLKYTDDTKANEVNNKLKDYTLTTTYNSGIETTKTDILASVSANYSTKQEFEDLSGNVDNLQTDLNNTKDNLSNNYTPTSEIELNYSTKTELNTGLNNITASFTESGGYNLIRNSSGRGGTSFWTNRGASSFYSDKSPFSDKGAQSTNSKSLIVIGNNTTINKYVTSSRIAVSPNTSHTISGKIYVNSGCKGVNIIIYISNSITDLDVIDESYDSYVVVIEETNIRGEWVDFSKTFTTPSSCKSLYISVANIGSDTEGTESYIYYSDLCLTLGSLKMPWSPHTSEVYDGITSIDKRGVTVYSSDIEVSSNLNSSGLDIYAVGDSSSVASFKRDGAFIDKITTNLVYCPTIPRIAGYYGMLKYYYVSDKMTGDGTGRDRDNCSNSIQNVLNMIKRQYGTILNGSGVDIVITKGSVITEDFIISGFSGNGWLTIFWEDNTIFSGFININNCDICVEYRCSTSGRYHDNATVSDYNQRHKIYTVPGNTFVFAISRSPNVRLEGLTAIVADSSSTWDADSYRGYFAMVYAGSRALIKNCDIINYKAIVAVEDLSTCTLINNGGKTTYAFSGNSGGIIIQDGKYPDYTNSMHEPNKDYYYLTTRYPSASIYSSRYLALGLSTAGPESLGIPHSNSTTWIDGCTYSPLNWTVGYYYTSSGDLLPDSGDALTDFMYCGGADTLTITSSQSYSYSAWFDKDKKFISQFGIPQTSLSVPTNAVYFRVCARDSYKDSVTITPHGTAGSGSASDSGGSGGSGSGGSGGPSLGDVSYPCDTINYQTIYSGGVASVGTHAGSPAIGNPDQYIYRDFTIILDGGNSFDSDVLETLATKSIEQIAIGLHRRSASCNDGNPVDLVFGCNNYTQLIPTNIEVGGFSYAVLNGDIKNAIISEAQNIINNNITSGSNSKLRISVGPPSNLIGAYDYSKYYAEFEQDKVYLYIILQK